LRYRRTDGNDVNWAKRDGAPPPIPIGGVIWSVGPDGIDQGGRNDGVWSTVRNPKRWTERADVIFPVPGWSKP
jgi:hypothetical protein